MNIKFISYDGSFPNLCSGTLTLEIDGKVKTFHPYREDVDYHFFWTSGGYVSFDEDWIEYVSCGPWELMEKCLPDELKPYGKQLIDIFNENVPHGCCGGCV